MNVELRQYTLHPGTRDVLIELFDREFVESQEAVGMQVFGQFRDLDDPDRFVWLRGFRDMPTRARALEAFYGGPVWKQHRDAANATMIDSDDVLLLRPARPWSGFSVENVERPPPGSSEEVSRGLVVAAIWHLDATAGTEFLDFFESAVGPPLKDAGASILGYFVTETSPNNFPALPVREDENVFVCISGFSDPAAYDLHVRALAPPDCANVPRSHRDGPDVLKLAPTLRSRLRG
jgi:quinol monooxygenase YgiN